MRSILASILAVALVACGGGADSDDQPQPQCSDGIDNDTDGVIDFPDDPSCTSENGEDEAAFPSPQCDDGRDNDGDGLMDYPADPGCVAPNQDDEKDDCPDGPNCPECGNDKDDDMNGSTDYPDDPGCTSASDFTEVVNNPVACGAGLQIEQLPTTLTIDGTLDGMSKSMIASPCGGGAGASAIAYQLYLPRPKVVVVSTADAGTTADTIIDIRKGECSPADAEVACNDNAPGVTNGGSKLTVSLAAGNYYIIVTAKSVTAGNTFSMSVKLFAGEGEMCVMDNECGPGLVCRIPQGGSAKSCQQPMCKDGVDNDGDSKIDYPNDPGCMTPDDNAETDSCPGVGPNCPECGDGTDNDGDTKTDFPMDTTCLAAGDSSESCVTTDGVTLITAPSTMGTTIGANNDVKPSCTSSSHTAPDRTYRLDLPALSVLDITLTGASWDYVHAVYDASCIGTNLTCVDFGAVHMTNVAAGTYFYVVDGWGTASGAYTIDVTGKIANNASCEHPLFAAGALSCNTNYTCAGTMGQRTCRGQACDDGADNDGDGKFDYPNDPGCTGPADNDEADPAQPPVCSDSMDNDSDQMTDWPMDYGCAAASGTTEAFCPTETNPTALLTSATTTATTAGLTSNFASQSCQSNASGPDIVYALSLPVPVASMHFDTNNGGFDSVLSLRDSQCANEIACDDDGGTPFGRSSLTVGNLSAGNYSLVIDGWSGAAGAFTLNAKGTVAPQTSCTSPLFSGGANALLVCPTGTTCTGTPAKCQ